MPADGRLLALIGHDTVASEARKQEGVSRAKAFRTNHGFVLPVGVWNAADRGCARASETSQRIVVAVHGMNDGAAAFEEIADAWSGEVRLDALWELINIMDEAATAAADVDRPVLIVHGTEDTLAAPRVVAKATEVMPKDCAALCWVDDASHLVVHETPGQRVCAARCEDRERPRHLWSTIAAWADGAPLSSSPCHARPSSPTEIEALKACEHHDDEGTQPRTTRSRP